MRSVSEMNDQTSGNLFENVLFFMVVLWLSVFRNGRKIIAILFEGLNGFVSFITFWILVFPNGHLVYYKRSFNEKA